MKILHKSLLIMNTFIGVSMCVGESDLPFSGLLDPSGCCGWERAGKEPRSCTTNTTSLPTFPSLDRQSPCSTQDADNGNINCSIAQFQVTINSFDQEMKNTDPETLKKRAERKSMYIDALALIAEYKMQLGFDLNKPIPLNWGLHKKVNNI